MVAAVVTLAAALRLPDLVGWWPNPDEGIYYGIVTSPSLSAAWSEAMATSHPPLYFFLLRTVGWLSTDFVALRSVAFVSGCLAVWVFVLLGREIGGDGARARATGLLAGLLLAVSPRAIVLSQVMRPYMLQLLLLAASLLFLIRYLRAPSPRLLVAHATCSLLAALLHYGSLFGLGTMGLLVLYDGLRRGSDRPEWRRLLAVQLVPATTLAVLYAVHLRGIASSPLGVHAVQGWLAGYMVSGPGDVWLGFVAFHSMLAGEAWAAPAAILTLAATGWAAWRRQWSLVLLTGAALTLAVGGSAAQLYPFGPTRHTAWLVVFVLPTLAWALGSFVTLPRAALVRVAPLAAVALLGAKAGDPWLDPPARPREISEHVLREAGVEAMAEVLDPDAEPRLALMSQETYQLLIPLYAVERQSAERSADGELLHFRWGSRDVVVLPGRDFLARPDQLDQANHLYTAAVRSEAAFGLPPVGGGRSALVLAGGWRSQGMADLVDLAGGTGPMGTTLSVPGLVGIYLNWDAYARALGAPAP